MHDQPNNAVNYPLLARPHIQLYGTVDEVMYAGFKDQLAAAPADGPLVVSITTLGGDPEMARAMGDSIRLLRDHTGRDTLFLGKVAVYSAGATFMSAFPVEYRFLTRGTRLMLHERQMSGSIDLSGPLTNLPVVLKAKLHEIEQSVLIQEEGFRAIVNGSKVTFETLQEKARSNWYIDAEEARELGLVLDVI
ncbi:MULTISPECIES: ATP-dependent Clp protease proteolytic subunit [unclassified Sphingomonas]|uniref:ClpP family protease n=1 Tax=unclassified Sphingomonas TaxID=196159 RepID=UPI00285EB259|nr:MULTISPECIES: ATP-dependent Clp protease proteolytic subunit [unclassified Sphingomonas]MDR6114853.1 ATP-dependent Clp protease protease subunit [Sphingomonas sp. SORGH_AS_0789]MDR6151474.1 ATP-dependent Clp protease protease subunit [Sphingomonas sp. SORGH_AS_0742]